MDRDTRLVLWQLTIVAQHREAEIAVRLRPDLADRIAEDMQRFEQLPIPDNAFEFLQRSALSQRLKLRWDSGSPSEDPFVI